MAAHKKKARQENAHIALIDQSGFMLQPVRRRTWAPQGHTPIQRVWERHDRLSVQAAITLPPKRCRLGVYFRLYTHNIVTEDVVAFGVMLLGILRRKVILILDRWSVHRSAVAILQERYPDQLEVEWLPAYAPELNPAEYIWDHTKYGDLANFVPDDLEELADAVMTSMAAQHHDNALIRAFFKHAKLTME